MEKYQDTALVRTNGILRPYAGALVYVRDSGTQALAVLYSDAGLTTKGNPTSTNEAGFYSFYVADGLYDITIVKSGFDTATLTAVEIVDSTAAAVEVDVQAIVDAAVEGGTQDAIDAAAAYTDTEIAAAVTTTVDGQTFTTQQALANYFNAKFASQGSSAAVANAAPASIDTTPAAEQADISITYGTYTGGAVTSRTWRIDIANNGALSFNVAAQTATFTGAASGTSATLTTNWTRASGTYSFNFSNGDVRNCTLTNGATTCTWTGALGGGADSTAGYAVYAVPAGAQALALRIIETANYSGGFATNASAVYTIGSLGAAPTVLVQPTISPASPSGSDTLVLNQGTYANDDGSLTFTIRWVTEWTATGSFTGGETSATLTSVWTGSTGARTLTFSNGDSKSGNCTNNSTSVTWTGGLSAAATSTIGVSVNDTDRNMGAVPQMEGHVVRGYETPTNSFGTGSEVQASNTVTPTTTSTDTGVAWSGLTSTQWTNITDRAAVTGDTLAAGAQAAVAAIPTTGGVTIAVGGDVRAALAANTRVFVAAGTHNISAGTYLQLTNKELICLSGVAVLNLSACTTSTRYGAVRTGNSIVSNIRFDNAPSAAIADFGGSLINRVLVDHFGNQTPIIASGSGLAMEGSGTRVISFEARHGFSHAAGSLTTGAYGGNAGGDADGVTNHGGANFFADAHVVECSDDGWDFWNATAGCHLYYCSATLNGRNSLFPASNQLGDGNGFKYGQGTAGHYNNWPITDRNRTYGHNYNANLTKAVIKGATNTSNESDPYAFGSGEPAAHYTVIA